ncbi:hypothetical protein HOLleu_41527 [Holothuria leucospilota]|uniref:Transmembrane protein 163 n=1 Tax=Holothuria leucospilota TaxID=206669 RepID=A0A9Q1B9P5_HOLLE|nr:hypothetical protein HOLleu_41527 [Holothuria leucospilota]
MCSVFCISMGTYSKHGQGNEADSHEMTSLLSGVRHHGVKNDESREETGYQLTKNKYGGSFSHLCEDDVIYYIRGILLVSWVSILVSVGLGSASMVLAYTCHSSAAFGFAFDCIIDMVSSCVLIWRFSDYHGNFNEEEVEKITLVALGSLFIISSGSIMYHSISSLAFRIPKSALHAEKFEKRLIEQIHSCEGKFALGLTSVSALIFLLVTATIVYIGVRLNSRSIKADGIIGAVALATTLTWCLSLVTIGMFPQLWYLEEAVGLFVGIFCFCYGIWLISELVVLIRNGNGDQKD